MKRLPMVLVMLGLGTQAQAQVLTSGGYRAPTPEVIANGGIRFHVIVNDSIVSNHTTQHVAQSIAVTRMIVCQLMAIECEIVIELHQTWRIEPKWTEVQRPTLPVPGSGGMEAIQLFPTKIDSVGNITTKMPEIAVGDSLEFYYVGLFDGGVPYVCVVQDGVPGGREVVLSRGTLRSDSVLNVVGWAGGEFKPAKAQVCAINLSSSDSTIATVRKKEGLLPFERPLVPLSPLRQG